MTESFFTGMPGSKQHFAVGSTHIRVVRNLEVKIFVTESSAGVSSIRRGDMYRRRRGKMAPRGKTDHCEFSMMEMLQPDLIWHISTSYLKRLSSKTTEMVLHKQSKEKTLKKITPSDLRQTHF